jgi:hypothetical protein
VADELLISALSFAVYVGARAVATMRGRQKRLTPSAPRRVWAVR